MSDKSVWVICPIGYRNGVRVPIKEKKSAHKKLKQLGIHYSQKHFATRKEAEKVLKQHKGLEEVAEVREFFYLSIFSL